MGDIKVSLPNGSALAETSKEVRSHKVPLRCITCNYYYYFFFLHSANQSFPVAEEQGLSFSNVCVDVAEKRILWSINGEAKPGRILALMGPSGMSHHTTSTVTSSIPFEGYCLLHARTS